MRLLAIALLTEFLKNFWMTMRPHLLFVSGITGLAGLSFAPPLPALQTGILFLVFFVAGLAAYSFFKRRWWGGPFSNGLIVTVLFLIGYACGLGAAPLIISDPVYFALICVLFGSANVVLVGYFKDAAADAEAGRTTMVVAFGRDLSAAVSDIFAIVFVITGTASVLSSLQLPGAPVTALHTSAVGVLWIASAVSSIAAQIRLHKVERDADAFAAIAPSVHTYILMLCAISASNKPEWTAALVLLYFGFAATIAVRPESSQI